MWLDSSYRQVMIFVNCLYDNFWSGGPIKTHDIPLWSLEHQDLFCITNLKIYRLVKYKLYNWVSTASYIKALMYILLLWNTIQSSSISNILLCKLDMCLIDQDAKLPISIDPYLMLDQSITTFYFHDPVSI